MTPEVLTSFKAARRVSTPLIGIVTADPTTTIMAITKAVTEGTGAGTKPPVVIKWEIINGAVGLNETGNAAVARLVPEGADRTSVTGNLAECLALCTKLPPKSILFVQNVQLYLENPAVQQAIWNLRDLFKGDQRTCVLLGIDLPLPPVLAGDVVVFEEPLPDDATIRGIVMSTFRDAKLDEPAPAVLAEATNALRGLSTFLAEQTVVQSLSRRGLDLDAVWGRKRASISTIRGLTVMDPDEEEVGGNKQILHYFDRMMMGPAGTQVQVFCFMDEIEKMMAGAAAGGIGDSSGVSQDQLGVVLKYIEDNKWLAALFMGPPGVSKTLMAKILAKRYRKLLVGLDLGAMKGSYVGQSEAQTRTAFRSILGMAGKGGAFFLATCNRLEVLTPELRRRTQTGGIWYFDLPTPEERLEIWAIHRTAFKIAVDDPAPPDKGWTGADIRNACRNAYLLQCSLREAAQFIVPVAKSDPETILRLRKLAHRRFLSASLPGPYRDVTQEDDEAPAVQPAGRQINLED